MKKAWALSKIYINSLYGISGFVNDLKANRKSALKKIGLIVLVLFGLSGTVSTFVIYNIALYDLLAPIKQEGLLISNTIITAAMFTLVFGIVSIIATYFVDKEGDIILSIPIRPWNILFAKFVSNYITEGALALVITATGVAVYGIKSGEGFLFYLVSFVIALLIPIIPMVISYIIVIPLMKAGNLLKKKDAVMILSGFIAVAFILAIQMFFQNTMMGLQTNPEALRETLTSPNGMVSIGGKIYPPSLWGTYAIIDNASSKGLMGLILMILTAVIGLLALHYAMSGLYVQSLIGSTEVRKSNKKLSEKELKNSLQGKSKLYSLLDREIKLLNREPVFFLNGPFIIILLPVIFGIMIFTQKGTIVPELMKVLSFNNASYYLTLIIGAAGAALGSMSSITASSISREGKSFMFIKSMPIDPAQYINAKLLHGEIFGVLGSLVACVIGYFLPGITIARVLIAFVIAQLLMLPSFVFGMLLELAWPKLIWDNPQKAVKQNLNVLIIVLGAMFGTYALGAIVYFLLKTPIYGYLALTVVPAIVGVTSYVFLIRYARKRFYEIEA